MLHTLAYTSEDLSAGSVDMTAVPDNWVPIQNGHYLPPQDLFLFGAFSFGDTLTAVQLVTPKSRMIVPPFMYPLVGALAPPDRLHVYDRRSNPFRLSSVEEIQLLGTAGSAEDDIIVLLVGDRIDPIPAGDIYALHGTSSDSAVDGVWTQVAVTWDQNLPAGTYAVVGSQHVATNCVAHRFNFPGQIMRPGFSSLVSLADISEPSYYYGGWGVLGKFVTYAFPLLEVLCAGTDGSHDFVMNLIKVG
jgi:hypothetical protein